MSEVLADEIWEIVLGWDNLAKDTIGKQIVRSADSVGANIAEGEGGGTHLENRRFVRIARGSLQETQHWLRRAFKRNLLTGGQIDKLKPLIENLSPSLNAYIRSISESIEPKTKNQKLKTKIL